MNSTPLESIQNPVPASTLKRAGWWRSNAWWLLGTAVLGTWAIYVPYREALHDYLERHPSHPIIANKVAWTSFEGARWRLVGSEVLALGAPRLQSPLRKDAGVLLIRFEVIPDSGTTFRALDSCRGAVVDAQGRRWEADPTGLPRISGSRLPNTCGSGHDTQFKKVLAVPGRPFVFQHVYLLPRAQKINELEVRIEFEHSKTAKGKFLKFSL